MTLPSMSMISPLALRKGPAVGVQHLRPLHHDVERRGLHRGQRARRPEEGEVLAVLAVAVPHGHGFDELVDGQVRLGCQILQRVGLVAEALGDRVGALEGVGARRPWRPGRRRTS